MRLDGPSESVTHETDARRDGEGTVREEPSDPGHARPRRVSEGGPPPVPQGVSGEGRDFLASSPTLIGDEARTNAIDSSSNLSAPLKGPSPFQGSSIVGRNVSEMNYESEFE